MKITAIIGMLLLAINCGQKAVGDSPQVLFGHDKLWLWWIACAGWASVAIRLFYARID